MGLKGARETSSNIRELVPEVSDEAVQEAARGKRPIDRFNDLGERIRKLDGREGSITSGYMLRIGFYGEEDVPKLEVRSHLTGYVPGSLRGISLQSVEATWTFGDVSVREHISRGGLSDDNTERDSALFLLEQSLDAFEAELPEYTHLLHVHEMGRAMLRQHEALEASMPAS
jgi:hypothetical protein